MGLGAVVGGSWGLLGRSWGPRGPRRRQDGLGGDFAHIREFLVGSGGLRGGPGGLWVFLGGSWRALRGVLGGLWRVLGNTRESCWGYGMDTFVKLNGFTSTGFLWRGHGMFAFVCEHFGASSDPPRALSIIGLTSHREKASPVILPTGRKHHR